MTRLITDGAEMGDLLLFFSTDGGTTVDTNIVRSGLRSYRLSPNVYTQVINIPSLSEFYLRVPMYLHDCPTYWRSGTTQIGGFRRNPTSGKIELLVGSTVVATGNKVVPTNTWTVYEIYFKMADAGVISLKIDGTADVTYSGDTKPGAETSINNFRWVTTISYVMYLDDFALNDTNGAVDNSWCGDGKIIALTPNATGDVNQLTPSSGATGTFNWNLVDEVPSDADTTYVEGGVVGERDLYNLTASGLAGVTVLRVFAESRSKDTVAAGGLIQLVLKTGGTEYVGVTGVLATSYARVLGTEYLLNPTSGSPWTVADLDALQAGPQTTS